VTKHATARRLKVCLNATFFKSEPKIDGTATRNLTYGLFLLTSKDGEVDNGCIVNTAFQVASDPFKIAISCQNWNYTKEIIEKSGVFNLSVLTEDVPFEFIKHFGMQSGKDVDKVKGYDGFERAFNGLVYMTKHTNAYFSVKVENKIELGSHTLFVGTVTESKTLSKNPSCTYAHYHKSIKPKA